MFIIRIMQEIESKLFTRIYEFCCLPGFSYGVPELGLANLKVFRIPESKQV